jgi:hypothetical protein
LVPLLAQRFQRRCKNVICKSLQMMPLLMKQDYDDDGYQVMAIAPHIRPRGFIEEDLN